MFQPIYHVSVSPTDGNGPTQGQRKTLTRVTRNVGGSRLNSLVSTRISFRDFPLLYYKRGGSFELFLSGLDGFSLGDPGAVSRGDKMSVVKVYCKIETSPWALTLNKPVPEAFELPV